jgi:hypothetical protein
LAGKPTQTPPWKIKPISCASDSLENQLFALLLKTTGASEVGHSGTILPDLKTTIGLFTNKKKVMEIKDARDTSEIQYDRL